MSKSARDRKSWARLERRILAVRCIFCHAKPGEPCTGQVVLGMPYERTPHNMRAMEVIMTQPSLYLRRRRGNVCYQCGLGPADPVPEFQAHCGACGRGM